MTAGSPASVAEQFDPLTVCAAFAGLCGAASVVFPFFSGVTLTLVALGLAVWVGREVASPSPLSIGPRTTLRSLVALSVLGGFVVYLAPLGAAGPLRGLLLGLSIAPAGWVGRGRRAFGEPGGP
ncbi:MAG: hypothetical protein L3K09_06330 [Thermoplasmata archaeon]|nr:hypothetical protein [Thermoplasmata archaeon]